MHVSVELFIVVLFSVVLLISAAMRNFAKLSGIPFTILMLVIGLGAGAYVRTLDTSHGLLSFFHHSGEHSLVSPEMILFIFLPMLIFESAFSLDAHLFKKLLPNISLLAGPAILFTTLCTAYLMLTITPASWGWNLSYALLFGALINATDPVAVVALLRELGISKRLVTLIEGESLLNDGTAIVLFTVFLGVSLVGFESVSLTDVLIKLLKVVAGGLLVGWLLAQFISRWIGKIFNDPLLEITLMMALAYLAMAIAEGFLHVSGVMALVIAGLYMSSVGRTRISPEVIGFLHEFWEMMAYIANALIFFLVGLVIALQIKSVQITEIWIAFVAYFGVMIIRAIAVFLFRPLFAALKNPITKDQAIIVSWGGLRGAVSLALALMLSQTPGLDEGFRQQALLFTAIIVLCTVIFNGVSMKFILRILGLDKPTLATQISANLARVSVLGDVKSMINELSSSSNFRNVYWADVRGDVDRMYEETKQSCDDLQQQIEHASPIEHKTEFWLRVLNVERSGYWELFSQGILSRKAISILNHEIDNQVDNLKQGNLVHAKQRTPKLSQTYKSMNVLFREYRSLQKQFSFIIFENLMLRFHCYHAEQYAAKKVLENLPTLEGMHKDIEEQIRETYTGYLNNAKMRIEQMRASMPDLTQAIETYFAKRLTLNCERDGIKKLMKYGIIDEGIAHDTLHEIETRMHELEQVPTDLKQPSPLELLREVPLFEYCSEDEIKELAESVVENIILTGEDLFKESETSDSMYIIVRGALEIRKTINEQDTVLAVLGGGEIVGEMALLTHQPRMATATASTDVTVLKITADDFDKITQKSTHLLEHTWLAYGRHLLDNLISKFDQFKPFSQTEVKHMIETTKQEVFRKGLAVKPPSNALFAFVISGQVEDQDSQYPFASLITLTPKQTLTASEETRLLWIFQ